METEKAGVEVVVVLTTVEKEEDAEQICNALLEKKLAACTQIVGPVKSRYWWEGKIESATEFLCIIKTVRERYGEVEGAIRASHPYAVPEILCIRVDDGFADYMKWLQKIVLGK
ncbi:MAG: divalent-cation tolerance protein CutA [Thermoplasmata archaeon]|nr:divalent-cation tolerance protein CutA [Thermoplasmata archaeon]